MIIKLCFAIFLVLNVNLLIVSTNDVDPINSNFVVDSLDCHNFERNKYGVPSLLWSTDLAASAQAYSALMALTDTTAHSTESVNDVGENLAWDSGSSITISDLVARWLAEKQDYIPGTDFPDVSITGNWRDVAHYTQLMWAQTTHVGCGIAQASFGRYNYVCHYLPKGNIKGESVYTVATNIPLITSTGGEFALPVEEEWPVNPLSDEEKTGLLEVEEEKVSLKNEEESLGHPQEAANNPESQELQQFGAKFVIEEAIKTQGLPNARYEISQVFSVESKFDVELKACNGLTVRAQYVVYDQEWSGVRKVTSYLFDVTERPNGPVLDGCPS